MTRVYYKSAQGAFVVFDVTRATTHETVAKWKADIDAKVTLPPDDRPIPCILLANKCDLPNRDEKFTDEFLDQYCKDHGFLGWFDTSAKENMGIDDAAKRLVGAILEDDPLRKQPAQDPDVVNLHASKPGQQGGKEGG